MSFGFRRLRDRLTAVSYQTVYQKGRGNGGGGGGVGALFRDRLTAVSYQTVYFWEEGGGGGGYPVAILPVAFKAVSNWVNSPTIRIAA